MYDMVAQRLRQAICERGFILDGFPAIRLRPDADALLSTSLSKFAARQMPAIVIRIDVTIIYCCVGSPDRRSCPVCGRIYNVYSQPPRVADKCDVEVLAGPECMT